MIGALVGLQLKRLPSVSPVLAIASVPVVLVAAYVLSRSARMAVVAVLASTIFGLYAYSVHLGPVDIRVTDAGYVVLVVWALRMRSRAREERTTDAGQRYLVAFLVVFGVSLLPLLIEDRSLFTSPFVSWLRFVVTISLVWLIARVLPTHADRIFVLRAVGWLSALELGRALGQASLEGLTSKRIVGGNGPNVEGLLAVLLLVLVLSGLMTKQRLVQLGLVVLACASVISAASIASIAALGVTLAAFSLRPPQTSDAARRGALITPARTILLVAGIAALVITLRPESLPSSETFATSSTNQRLILGDAGLREFRAHPILGVGWQRSSSPDVIGDPALSDALRAQFQGAPPQFFPDQLAATVHNAYVQILAEAGIVGAASFIALFVAARRRIRALLATLTGEDRRIAWTALLGIVILLIWWNDNPLFGAQPETVLFATLFGILASFRRVERASTELESLDVRAFESVPAVQD